MSRRLLAPRLTAVAGALILAAGLAGCGKVGGLEPARPLFGQKGQAAEQVPVRQDPNRPIETVDPRDRQTDTQIPASPGAQPPPAPTPPQ